MSRDPRTPHDPIQIAGHGASLTDQPTVRYAGERSKDGVPVVTTTADGTMQPLPWQLKVRNHSLTGLEWGYGG